MQLGMEGCPENDSVGVLRLVARSENLILRSFVLSERLICLPRILIMAK